MLFWFVCVLFVVVLIMLLLVFVLCVFVLACAPVYLTLRKDILHVLHRFSTVNTILPNTRPFLDKKYLQF